MVTVRDGWMFLAAAALAMSAGMVRAQRVRPVIPTTQPAASGAAASAASRPAVSKIPQPAAFLALAAKARKIKAVYVKGAVISEVGKTTTRPAKSEQTGFEIWARPPAVKLQLDTPDHELRLAVQAGRSKMVVYTFTSRRGAQARGRRQRIVAANFYEALAVAAVFCDAASGYANLAGAVRFDPVAGEPDYAKTMPDLKWFLLAPVTKPRHYLAEGTRAVKVGISPRDGLMRVLTARVGKEDQGRKITFVFRTVRHTAIRDEDLTLPAAAAQAKWTDADTGEAIPAPRSVIEKSKP